VPLAAVTALTITRSHLGKTNFVDLLKVDFSADGGRDSIAWYLTKPHDWKSKIETLKADGGS
jgi:hypothetical protein